jgi:3-methyladenine DNA glycosylase AlkD
VDGVAPRVRDLLLAHPATMTPLLREWARSPDRWLRRSAVIAQLGARTRTDTALLTVVVEVNAADPEFFVRKAIGWALPDFDRTDPGCVRREAAKHLGLNGSAGATLLLTSSVDVPAGTRSKRRA